MKSNMKSNPKSDSPKYSPAQEIAMVVLLPIVLAGAYILIQNTWTSCVGVMKDFYDSAVWVLEHILNGVTWASKQNYTGVYAEMYTKLSNKKEWIMLSFTSLILVYVISLYLFYVPPAKPRATKRKLEDDFEDQHRHIKRRLSIQAEKYRHASAFQTIQQQVGEDPRSWPVILLNEVILLREDLARVQKKEF
jgi:hypothetical protein